VNIKVHGSDCGLVGGIILTFWSNWENPQKKPVSVWAKIWTGHMSGSSQLGCCICYIYV